jgi:hypothetical protein
LKLKSQQETNLDFFNVKKRMSIDDMMRTPKNESKKGGDAGFAKKPEKPMLKTMQSSPKISFAQLPDTAKHGRNNRLPPLLETMSQSTNNIKRRRNSTNPYLQRNVIKFESKREAIAAIAPVTTPGSLISAKPDHIDLFAKLMHIPRNKIRPVVAKHFEHLETEKLPPLNELTICSQFSQYRNMSQQKNK